MHSKVKAVLEKHKTMISIKQPWLEHFQLIGEYINLRKQNFTETNSVGAFLTRDIFDNTAGRDNDIMASALIGALWQNGAQSIQLIPARGMTDDETNRIYFNFLTEEATSVMDAPRAGLSVALTEYMRDQGSFGTSGVGVFENEDSKTKKNIPIRYIAFDIKTMTIDEDQFGFVDTVYDLQEMTINQAVKKYKLKNLSIKSKELFAKGVGFKEKIKVLHAIEPRLDGDPTKFGNKDMPVASIHVELSSGVGQNCGKILKESGYNSMPIFVTRFNKNLGEPYGRSSGMAGLPDAIELNAIWEALTIAIEKQIDPPLGILSDGDLTPVIDTSAGAMNVFNISGRLGSRDPVFPLFTIGELKSVEKLIEKLTESLSNHFYLDRLLDLNNDTRMTLGEAQIRNELRAASLGSIYSRQISELFVPMIDRTVALLYKLGRLGVVANSKQHRKLILQGITPIIMPVEVAQRISEGRDFFKIKFISPAARSMQAEEIQGILGTTAYATQVVVLDEGAKDVIDVDASIKRIAELTGASLKTIKSLQAIQDLRRAKDAIVGEQLELEKALKKSEIARNLSNAQSTIQNTGGGGGANKVKQ